MVSFRNDKTFRIYNILLTVAGVPLYNRPTSFLYNVYDLIVFICTHCTTLSVLMYLYINIDDLDKAIDSIFLSPLTLLSSWIRISLSVRRDDIQQLLIRADCFTWDGLPARDPDTGNISMTVFVRRIKKVLLGVVITACSFHLLQTTIRIIISEERPLTFDMWYPYDVTKSPAYEFTLVFQTTGMIIGCAVVLYIFPPLYATLVVIACFQYEKLRALLSDIKQRTEDGDEQFDTSEDVFASMQSHLNECIRLHQKLIRYKSELDDTFSNLFVGVFLLLLLSLCTTTYTAVLRWGSAANIVQSLISYIVCLIFVFLLCWFPSELSDQADRFRDAVWGCDWVGTPVQFQRSLSFLITCAIKEVTLKAGKCVPISKQTILTMVQESFSLFMFLLQVRDKDNEA